MADDDEARNQRHRRIVRGTSAAAGGAAGLVAGGPAGALAGAAAAERGANYWLESRSRDGDDAEVDAELNGEEDQ